MTVLYNQIAQQMQGLIEEGAYRVGDRLPGVRVLSRRFGVSISTILQAHQLLESRGYLQARERSGYFVSLPATQAPMPTVEQVAPLPSNVSARQLALEMMFESQDRSLVPLGAAVPHTDYLPMKQVQQAMAWASRQGGTTMQYAFPGKLALRRQLAQRMTSLGVPVSPDELMVTGGSQEAIVLALRAVTQPGDIVAVESPTFPGILQVAELLGLRVIEVPSDPVEGVSLEGLQLVLDQWPVRACVVVANHSNPLGCRLSDERKQRLVNMMARAGVPLVEDDIYGDLPFSGDRPRPLKAFDRTDSVIYCSSFSKTMCPGLRIGWIVPGRFFEAVVQQKYFMNIATATVPQLAVARLLDLGGYDRYLRSARQRYEEAVGRMRVAIERYFPEGTAVSRPVGGMVLWIQLPEGLSGTVLHRRAREQGISISAGQMFSVTHKYENCLRLNGANPWDETIEKAVRRLGELARDDLVW
ncbi:PLP-dependent aminotransferase family protein [Marinobacteraceae bacterium S3BR75-40.1]